MCPLFVYCSDQPVDARSPPVSDMRDAHANLRGAECFPLLRDKLNNLHVNEDLGRAGIGCNCLCASIHASMGSDCDSLGFTLWTESFTAACTNN